MGKESATILNVISLNKKKTNKNLGENGKYGNYGSLS